MKKDQEKKNRVIDLRRFFEKSEMVMPDENGSYTGMPAEYFLSGSTDVKPVQDADDL